MNILLPNFVFYEYDEDSELCTPLAHVYDKTFTP